MMFILGLLCLPSAAGGWAAGIGDWARQSSKPAIEQLHPRHAPHRNHLQSAEASSSRWWPPATSTFATYAGVGLTTAGLASAATAVAGTAAGTALACSVALPMAVALVEIVVLGGPRVARMMGGKPAGLQLTSQVHEVFRKASLPPPAHVFEINTMEPNAFAAGLFQRDRTVAVTSGLRAALTDKELKAVIAHEMGHLRHLDVHRNMHLAAAAAGLGGIYHGGRALLRYGTGSSSSKDKDKEETGVSAAALGIGMMAMGLVSQGAAQLIRLSVGRSAEFRADEAAAEMYGPATIASALRKIDEMAARPSLKRDKLGARGNAFAHMFIAPEPSAAASARAASNAGSSSSGRKWRQWLSTHPSMDERIQALERLPARSS